MMPEGRITIDGGFTNEYFIKDHLGNTRAIVNQSGELLETDNYYPFGMQIQALLSSIADPENIPLQLPVPIFYRDQRTISQRSIDFGKEYIKSKK